MPLTDAVVDVALRYATVLVTQAVISPSALNLMYPADEIPGYPREEFIADLLREYEAEVQARVFGTALAAERLGVA